MSDTLTTTTPAAGEGGRIIERFDSEYVLVLDVCLFKSGTCSTVVLM